MATKDSSTFYPEDAQEQNFKNVADLAAKNHERDLAGRSVGGTEPDRVETKQATEVINPVADPVGVEYEKEKDA